MASTSTQNIPNGLDLKNVVKASQILSGEIVLNRLLKKMMHILLENTGAKKGFLLLPQQDNWIIEVEGYIDSVGITVLQSIAIEASKRVSVNIIHHVARTLKNVILHNAVEKGDFTHDPHIVQYCPKSVLCTPLINQGKLIGILYLENKSTANVFTSDRLEILNLLFSQITISIENALIHAKLESKIKESTHTIEVQKKKLKIQKKELEVTLRQLQSVQTNLMESKKMASLGNLVAGVAHEINTPVGIGVTGASQLEVITKELVQLFSTQRMKRSDLQKYLDSAEKISNLILRNLNRAAELVQSFKQVAVDQATEQRRRFMLKKYLNEVILSLKPKLKGTQYHIIIECDEDIVLFSYPGFFYQIIINFVVNSLIHGFQEKGEGQMIINISPKEKETLILRYSDNGKGMSQEVAKNIFEPFFTTNRHGSGTGLGLHIVYNLVVHELNGTINCESVEGKGTMFIIEFPYSS
ncbi:GAF domain-containing sensor histidine kinase [Candidatus Parabeggiatoa sp. HSG14]|uniref:GAF domain-containing sensor histidine kinase n=1 Tax=Candidatus Parabeggiatoa sp. HSG14 TaxID=3055593 RepID=UPI0025A82FEF|nr:GAF domain-containing sensor histidine kinase [Thiotrichales bacterium HSG14]